MADLPPGVTQADVDTAGERLVAVREAWLAQWDATLATFQAYKIGRDGFGLPLTDPAGYSDADYQHLVDLQEITRAGTGAVFEALNGLREVSINPALGILAIEALPTDKLVLRTLGANLSLVDKATGQPVNATGQVGNPIVLAVIGGVAALATWAFCKYEDCQLGIKKLETERAKIAAQTQVDLLTSCANLVAAGTYTPEQCEKLTRSIQTGQAEVLRASAEDKKAGDTSPIADTVSTGLKAIVGLGFIGLAVYAISQLAPAITAGKRQTASNPVGDMPLPPGTRVSSSQHARGEGGWEGVVLSPDSAAAARASDAPLMRFHRRGLSGVFYNTPVRWDEGRHVTWEAPSDLFVLDARDEAAPQGGISLHVGHEYGEVSNVWVEGVPSDVSDADVEYTFRKHAESGSQTAQAALAAVRSPWIDMAYGRAGDGVRVYRD